MPWAVAAAGIGAAGTLGAASMQSGAVGGASKQAQRNLELTLPFMQQQYNASQQGYQPYVNAGVPALNAETSLLGLNGQDAADAAMANFQASPGYQWALQQGLRGVDAAAAAKGMVRSGATLKAEQTYGEGLANQDFANYYNRLSGLATTGQNALTQQLGGGQSLISGITGNVTAQNNALISGANAQNSITGNTAQGLGNIANNLLSNKDFQSFAKGLFAPSNSTVGDPSTSGNYGTTIPGYTP
jgi:hypothetical protein